MRLLSKPRPHNFTRQTLKGRSFRGQDLTGLDFSQANLQGADFRDAILIDANFSHAQIQGANFTQAQLSRADFSHAIADLRNTSKTILWIASLFGAFLAGLGECLGPSWIMNLLVFENKLLQFGSANPTHIYSIAAGLISLEILTVFLILTIRSGIGAALRLGSIHALWRFPIMRLPISRLDQNIPFG